MYCIIWSAMNEDIENIKNQLKTLVDIYKIQQNEFIDYQEKVTNVLERIFEILTEFKGSINQVNINQSDSQQIDLALLE